MERLTEENILNRLQTLEFSPFKIRWNLKEKQRSQRIGKKYQIDAFAKIEWGGERYEFFVEIKGQSTPKTLDQALWQLEQYAGELTKESPRNRFYPMIVVPYLNEQRLETLVQRRISGIDLSGNGVLIIPGRLFAYRTGGENKFLSNAPIKNIFRGTSSIVSRTMFAKPEFASVNEVLREIEVRGGETTLATVSKVLKSLEEEFIISKQNGIRLKNGKLLLNLLTKNYRRPKGYRTLIGKAVNLEDALAKIAENANENNILCAVDAPSKYAVFPTAGITKKIYTTNITKSLKSIDFDETDRFPNIELTETCDKTIYFDRRWDVKTGYYLTSPIQTYLNLSIGGKREQETAEQIEEAILSFKL